MEDCESIVPISPYKFLEPGRNEITHSMSIKCPTTKVDELNLILNKTSCYGLFSSLPQNEEGYHKYDILCSVKELRNYKQFLEDNQCEFEVKNQTASKETLEGCGSGRICRLKTPISLSEAVDKVKKHINLPHLRLALAVGKTEESKIRSIALVAGSGASALRDAYADLYLTGEMLHHDILAANHQLTSVILINHSDSERGFLKEVAPRLESIFQNKVVVHVSKKDKDPLITV
uniref:NIF3-like protein 1 n=1 Tax=Clastoptera arizonana TaxID=38151 RepID=A0A1B6C875_9HEMI